MKKPHPSKKTVRNADLLKLYAAGVPIERLCSRFKISKARIWYLVGHYHLTGRAT